MTSQQIYTDRTRENLIEFQGQLNAMPLHQLGAMLSQAGTLKRSADAKERAIGTALYGQVLVAMEYQFTA